MSLKYMFFLKTDYKQMQNIQANSKTSVCDVWFYWQSYFNMYNCLKCYLAGVL